jgi:hypothetical protein
MSDGAHLGVKADRALNTVLGGAPQPVEDEQMTAAEMREWLLSAPRCTDPAAMADYGECARSVAGEVLRWALANPERYANTPAESALNPGPDGKVDWSDPHKYGVTVGLYAVLKDEGVALDTLGITGFQWGWAYNAARRCLELPPEPNPAFLTIGGDAHEGR